MGLFPLVPQNPIQSCEFLLVLGAQELLLFTLFFQIESQIVHQISPILGVVHPVLIFQDTIFHHLRLEFEQRFFHADVEKVLGHLADL